MKINEIVKGKRVNGRNHKNGVLTGVVKTGLCFPEDVPRAEVIWPDMERHGWVLLPALTPVD